MSLRPNRDRERRYRSGNTVYGSGRNSPHEGTKLDPSGYIERELKKKRVAKRSRLAQGALGRLARNNQGAMPTGTTARSTSYSLDSGGPDSQPVFNHTSPTSFTSNSNDGTSSTPDPQQPQQPEQPGQFQPPKATLNGKLIPMPWEMQMQWINNATDWAQQNAAWDTEVNQSNIELGQYLRDLAQQRVRDNSTLANNQAAKGLSFSSGNAWGIGDLANTYAKSEADAKNWVQELLGRIGVGGSERAMGQSSYNMTQAMIQAEAARILAEQAGTLGLGNQPTNPLPPDGSIGRNGEKIDTSKWVKPHVGLTLQDKYDAANTKPQDMNNVWSSETRKKRRRKGKK